MFTEIYPLVRNTSGNRVIAKPEPNSCSARLDRLYNHIQKINKYIIIIINVWVPLVNLGISEAELNEAIDSNLILNDIYSH